MPTRFQLSFRRFFSIWMLIAVLLCAWSAEKISIDNQVTALRKAGVRVTRYSSWFSIFRPSYIEVELEFPRGTIPSTALHAASKLRRVVFISAEWNESNSHALNSIVSSGSVKCVTFLNATDTLFPLSDSFKKVTTYKFCGKQFSGLGIGKLVGSESVISLDVSGTSFCDSALSELKGYTSLESLTLDYTLVSDQGIKFLGELRLAELSSLSADCPSVSCDAARYLIGLDLRFLQFYVHRRGNRDVPRSYYYADFFPNCKFKSTWVLEPTSESRNASDDDGPFD